MRTIKLLILIIFGAIVIIGTYLSKTNANYQGWTKQTAKKENLLINNGMSPKFANYVINGCKNYSNNPKWCVELVAHLWIHESGRGKSERCIYNKSCFGLHAGLVPYDSLEQSFQDWLPRFNKYWWKHGYYGNKCSRMVYRSGYTTTQKPEWIRSCNYVQNLFNKL